MRVVSSTRRGGVLAAGILLAGEEVGGGCSASHPGGDVERWQWLFAEGGAGYLLGGLVLLAVHGRMRVCMIIRGVAMVGVRASRGGRLMTGRWSRTVSVSAGGEGYSWPLAGLWHASL